MACPGPKSAPGGVLCPARDPAGASLHKNNLVRQPAIWLKTIPACPIRPPPALTVLSQHTSRGSLPESL